MPHKDKDARKKYRKEYYNRTKEQAHQYYLDNKDKFRDRNRAARKRNKLFVNEHKLQTGCSRCGYNKNACALDFHHIESKKENVARLTQSCLSLDRLREEMSKCVILCANCHREEHYSN